MRWGLPEAAFAHRDGMITKAEVRAVVLGKLALPPAGVLWDVGAGSGSVGIEAARLCPGLRVFAIERSPERRGADAATTRATHGVTVEVVEGTAPGCLSVLPDPDRVFVGGGGLDVLGRGAGATAAGRGHRRQLRLAGPRRRRRGSALGHLVALNVAQRGGYRRRGAALGREPGLRVLGPGRMTVVVGIGASSRATAEEIDALVHEALAGAGLPATDVSGVATIAARAGDPRLAALGWPITGFDAAELAVVPVANEGPRAFEAVGTASVAEAAALLAAGTGSHLVAPKIRSAHATIALAQKAPAP